MYKKLRKKFFLLSMTIITVILFLLIGSINISNFSGSYKRSKRTLEFIALNDGEMPDKVPELNEESEWFKTEREQYRDERFFFVELKSDGTLECNLTFVNTIKEEDGKQYYVLANNKSKTFGKIDDYRYYKTQNKIYFLDCRHEFEAQKRFLFYSLTLTIGGLALFAVCLYFGSSLIFRNIQDNEAKQKEFITNASHELKTPLMIISANNELSEIKKGVSEETTAISKEITNMNKMISTLLTISKSSESMAQHKEKINLSLITKEIIETFEPIIKNSNLKLTTKIQKDLIVKSNISAVTEVMRIILDNAVKYAKTDITVSLRKNKKYIELLETNDSDFIEDKNLNYLTERFYRDETTSGKNSGSGIGLSLLASLLDKKRHILSIYSKNGRFCISIKCKF